MVPEIGARGVANLGGRWVDAVVRAVHPTGTLSVDEVGGSFMSDWHSVLPGGWVERDEERLRALAGADDAGPQDVRDWFAAIGIAMRPEVAGSWWTSASTSVLGEVLPRRALPEVYRLLRSAGWSAAALDPARPRPRWTPLWWNQVRMGGGDPAEVHPVGVADAVAALGLTDARDPALDAAIAALEAQHGLAAEVRDLAGRAGFADAFRDAHCNNPEWRPVDAWEVAEGPGGVPVIVVVDPHQGDHCWAILPGGPTAVVVAGFPGPEGRQWVEAAPSLAFFCWDLARARDDWARGIAAPRAGTEISANSLAGRGERS